MKRLPSVRVAALWRTAVAGFAFSTLIAAPNLAAADSSGYRRFPVPPPDPARCTMAPVDVPALVAATTATPVAIPLQAAEPVLVARGLAAEFADAGAPQVSDPFTLLPAASPGDRTAIIALETAFAACRNTGDYRRWFAFYSLAAQREIVAALDDRVEDFFRPDSLTPDDWVPVQVGPVVDLGDGRLAALVDFCEDRWVRVYVQEGGAWRIAGQADAPERPGDPMGCRYPDPQQPPSLEAST